MAESQAAQSRLKIAEDSLDAKSAEIAASRRPNRTSSRPRSRAPSSVIACGPSRPSSRTPRIEAAQYKTSWESAENKMQQGAAEREKVIAERDGLLGRIAVLQQPQDKTRQFKMAEATPVTLPPSRSRQRPMRARSAISPTRRGRAGARSPRCSPRPASISTSSPSAWARCSPAKAAPTSRWAASSRCGRIPATAAQGIAEPARRSCRSRHRSTSISSRARSAFGSIRSIAVRRAYRSRSRRAVQVAGLQYGAGDRDLRRAPGRVRQDGRDRPRLRHHDGYAHLHRILVAKGQRINGREEIGLLGSSGRSTGPHVHYEVVVNGTPQDPAKFLRAGKSVVVEAAAK